jgi:hypothetical protein
VKDGQFIIFITNTRGERETFTDITRIEATGPNKVTVWRWVNERDNNMGEIDLNECSDFQILPQN